MDERDRDYLEAITENARIALGYSREAGEGWSEDGKTVDAVAMRVAQVGELVKRVGPETLAAISGVDWRGAKAFREALVHGDSDLELPVLVDVVEGKLPGLLEAVEAALEADAPP
jgi:uncharacterized protein with HEPN domain